MSRSARCDKEEEVEKEEEEDHRPSESSVGTISQIFCLFFWCINDIIIRITNKENY